MENQTPSPENRSGNIFGWRISFISLGVILFTLTVAIFTGQFSNNSIHDGKSKKNITTDSIQKIDSLKQTLQPK